MNLEQFNNQRLEIEKRMNSACEKAGRSIKEVTLMAVTKTHHAKVVDLAAKAGIGIVGENRVQEVEAKKDLVRSKLTWELIGSLQSNKTRIAVKLFDRVQTVDRAKLVRRLDRICEEEGKIPFPILMQVNAGRDPAKFGVEIEEVEPLAEIILNSQNLKWDGLMTIAPLSDNPDVARSCFAKLKSIQDNLEEKLEIELPVLSMGMTGDFEIAIEEGSTLIRVGSALFGSR